MNELEYFKDKFTKLNKKFEVFYYDSGYVSLTVEIGEYKTQWLDDVSVSMDMEFDDNGQLVDMGSFERRL